jgi:glycerophosphoryl diester phosphodiesterase
MLPSLAVAGPVEIIAHRGASYDAPENTVAAYRTAWVQGTDACELDLWLTKDKQIVVLHDRDTKRVAGVDRKVGEQTFDEIRALDAGRWKGAKFAGEKIPTLKEMLATVPAGKRVFVEIKDTEEILAALDRDLKAAGLKPQQTPIICFSASVVAALKKRRPDLEAYWLVSLDAKNKKPPTAESLIKKAKEIGAGGLDLSASKLLDQAYADKIKATGLKLYVWTVNDPAVARRMAAIGVDGITTDRPGWLREQLGK